MTTTKVLAAIGLISIIAFAGVCVMLMSSGGDHTSDPGSSPISPDVDANTDGLSKTEVQTKLQHYADLLNASDGKTHYLVVSGSVHTYNNETSSVSGDCMINVAPGSATVSDGDLLLSSISESYSFHSGLSTYTSNYVCDYVIPYHAIVGIKIVKSLPSTRN